MMKNTNLKKKMTEWFKVIFFPLVFFKINIMFSTNMLHIP